MARRRLGKGVGEYIAAWSRRLLRVIAHQRLTNSFGSPKSQFFVGVADEGAHAVALSEDEGVGFGVGNRGQAGAEYPAVEVGEDCGHRFGTKGVHELRKWADGVAARPALGVGRRQLVDEAVAIVVDAGCDHQDFVAGLASAENLTSPRVSPLDVAARRPPRRGAFAV